MRTTTITRSSITRSSNRMTKLRVGVCLGVFGLLTLGGCTSESLRVALAAQQRADQVNQAVFDQQHESLRILLYRDLLHRLGASGVVLGSEQRTLLSTVWNERDLLEFWALQHERAAALRLAGVDTKLYANQNIVDLLIKQAEVRVDRVSEIVAEQVGSQLSAESATSTDTAADDAKQNEEGNQS